MRVGDKNKEDIQLQTKALPTFAPSTSKRVQGLILSPLETLIQYHSTFIYTNCIGKQGLMTGKVT